MVCVSRVFSNLKSLRLAFGAVSSLPLRILPLVERGGGYPCRVIRATKGARNHRGRAEAHKKFASHKSTSRGYGTNSRLAFSPSAVLAIALLLLTPLAACGGGGGGGGGSAAAPTTTPTNNGGGNHGIQNLNQQPVTRSPRVDGSSNRGIIAETNTEWHNTFGVTASQRTKPDTNGVTKPLDGRGYTVAVVDFGFHGGAHENLQSSLTGRQLYVTPIDDNDKIHGLAVAGIIGAQGGSNFPKGVAPGASLMMLYRTQVQDDYDSWKTTRILTTNSNTEQKHVNTLYKRWKEDYIGFKEYLEKNVGLADAIGDTQASLEKTLRGQFFKIEAITSGNNQGKYQFTQELKDRLQSTGAQPLVSINRSTYNSENRKIRTNLTKAIAAEYCHRGTNYDDLFKPIAKAEDDLFDHPHRSKNYVCGRPNYVGTSGSGVMPEYIFIDAMRKNSAFRNYMNRQIDRVDRIIDADPTDVDQYNVQRDLIYDLGKKGAVTVIALGNDGWWGKYNSSGPISRQFLGSYPDIFAHGTENFYATDSSLSSAQQAAKSRELNTFTLTVGALEGPFDTGFDTFAKVNAQKSNWGIAGYSNGCGESKERCLFVPLHFYTDVVKDPDTGLITSWKYQYFPLLSPTNDRGEKVRYSSGTSYASPVVTGSVALLVQYYKPANPTYNGVKAAQDLLDTTFGLGTCAGMTGKACRTANKLDDEVGHGLLDVQAALAITQPQNSPGVGLTAGSWASVPRMHRQGSVLALSTPFGDTATRLREVLNNAIVIDELGRGHRYALGALVGSGAGTQTGDLLFAAPAPRGFSIDRTLIGDKTVSLSFRQNTTPETDYIEGGAHKRLFASGAPTESFTSLLADSPTLSIAYGDTATGKATKGKLSSVFRLSYSDSALTGDSRDRHQPDEERGGQKLLRLSGTHGLAKLHSNKPSTRLRWQAALLSEDSETLGGTNRGVYGLSHGATTHAFSLGADQPLAHGLTLSADITSAKTNAGQGGLIARWHNVRALGWAVSLTRSSRDDTTLTGLRLSQPLRTSGGTLDLSYPARYFHEENRVEFDTARVGLRPSGRELRLELAQSRTIEPWLDLEGRLLYRHQPNHIENAAAEYGASLGIHIRF